MASVNRLFVKALVIFLIHVTVLPFFKASLTLSRTATVTKRRKYAFQPCTSSVCL